MYVKQQRYLLQQGKMKLDRRMGVGGLSHLVSIAFTVSHFGLIWWYFFSLGLTASEPHLLPHGEGKIQRGQREEWKTRHFDSCQGSLGTTTQLARQNQSEFPVNLTPPNLHLHKMAAAGCHFVCIHTYMCIYILAAHFNDVMSIRGAYIHRPLRVSSGWDPNIDPVTTTYLFLFWSL